MHAPLTPYDHPPGGGLSGEGGVGVTAVFCMVDGGKAFAAKSKTDAKKVHHEIVAIMRNVLRHVGASVLV